MEAKLIDLKNYERTGEGANGVSYNSLTDPLEMVKIYNADYPRETVYTELDVARKVYDLGIPSPEPGELITDGERLGIKFRKIEGKRSHARAISQEPERTEEFTREFARMCKQLHATEVPDGLFEDVKPQYLHLVDMVSGYTEKEKDVVRQFIADMPDSKTALHGDMHIGNSLTTLPKGAPFADPHDLYWIDLGYFSRGCPLMDIAMLHNICNYSGEEFIYENMHIHMDQGNLVWKYFVDEYFDGAPLDEVNHMMLPYTSVKMFLIFYNIGCLIPNYDRLVRETFNLK